MDVAKQTSYSSWYRMFSDILFSREREGVFVESSAQKTSELGRSTKYGLVSWILMMGSQPILIHT